MIREERMALQTPHDPPNTEPLEPLHYTTLPQNRIYAGDILACGFAMTVAAWLVAYVSRMPVVNAPGQVTVSAMLAMVFLGGIFTARFSTKGIHGAALAGAVSGIL